MGKKDKKKGKGVEKTIAKTEKKLAQKMKKKLALAGEDDIEDIVSRIEKEDLKKPHVVQKLDGPPPRRIFCSLTPHPYKDELIFFGGEFHNGHDTFVFNNLYIYKIASNEWLEIISPGAPPPRSSHQAIVTPANKGELWIFGGEFTTQSESQFHHFKDLWQFELETKKWTKIIAPGGPSPRSGHRMVLVKRQIIVFGGYHDTLQDYRYFNDLYSFSLDSRTWTKLEPTGTPPCPRSGCQMVFTPEGKILIWGGYSKVRIKKDVDQGTTYTDMFLLSPEKGDESGLKWKWSPVKSGGMKYGPRSGVSSAFSGKRAFTFGGSSDHETEEEMTAEFHNDLHSLDLSKFIWSEVTLSGKKCASKQRRRRRNKEGATEETDEMDIDEEISQEKVVDDGIFTVRVGGSSTEKGGSESLGAAGGENPAHPHPRINCSMAMKGSKLFLYGGSFEEGQIQHTLSDFYSIDTHKSDEWKTIIECDLKSQEWIESEDSGDEEDSDGSDSESDSDMDEDED